MDSATVTRWALVALLAALAGYHLWHALSSGQARRRSVDVLHAAMGLAMAMVLITDVGPTGARLLILGFAAATVWFALRALDPAYGPVGGNLRGSLCCVAMTGMVAIPLAAPSGSGTFMVAMSGVPGMATMNGMPGMGTALPNGAHLLLVGVLALQLVLVLWTARDLLVPSTGSRGCAAGRPHLGAQLAMAAGGACMVGLML